MNRMCKQQKDKYEYNDDYHLEFATVDTDYGLVYEAYIYKKGYEKKMLIASVNANNWSFEDFKNNLPVNVESNIELYEKLFVTE